MYDPYCSGSIPAAPYTVTYEPDLENALRTTSGRSLLALVRFTPQTVEERDPRLVRVGLPILAGPQVAEAWWSDIPVRVGCDGTLKYAENGNMIFVHLRVEESPNSAVADLVSNAYLHILGLARKRGYPYVTRVWNIVNDLNRGDGDKERYKQFCVGRARALDNFSNMDCRLPAASCVGSRNGDLVICLVAFRRPGQPIENPCQVSTCRYPRKYGPRSPSFSRAMLHTWSNRAELYISGTASIVGHETRWPYDVGGQIEETFRNLDVLLQCASRELCSESPARPDELSLMRIYVRYGEHIDQVRAALDSWAGQAVPRLFLCADICRRPLLVEIEGLWRRKLP